MAKKVTANLKMRIPAAGATAGPPVGANLWILLMHSMRKLKDFEVAT